MSNYIKLFSEIKMTDISSVGGKNASLGEMFSSLSAKGIRVPDGFAITSEAYWKFLDDNKIRKTLTDLLSKLDIKTFNNLSEIGKQARALFNETNFPDELKTQIVSSFRKLC